MSGELRAFMDGFFTGRTQSWTWGPITCVTPAGDRVRLSKCCDGGHASVAAAKRHAAQVQARIERTGR